MDGDGASRMRLNPLHVLAVAATLALAMSAIQATPMYAARSARTCDNCHLSPNEWVNPPVAERKCNMSCQSCHVDPAGGGVRNASGRFFGQSTLPAIATSPRPTDDWDRNAPRVGRRDRATSYDHRQPVGPDTFLQAVEEFQTLREATDDGWAWGTPGGEPDRYGLLQGRYGRLNADPMLRVGADLRLAFLKSGSLFFPMQVDVPVVFHPRHHLTLLANTGARGRLSGYSDTFDQDHSFYFREAFIMLHEAPGQAYAKAGRFVPSFGLRLDDHTSHIRRSFELDGGLPESRVSGIEVGAMPNYPFVNASWFRMAARNRVAGAWDITDVDDGWGTAINAGWRDLSWSVGASAMLRRRDLEEGGDTSTYGLYGVWNPWRHNKGLPLTYQAEYDVGSFQRSSGRQTDQSAFYQEANWVAYNGMVVLLAHDWSDPDTEIIDDEDHRLQVGLQLSPIAGVTVDGRFRVLLPTQGKADADLFFQLHLYR
ncbi:MAG: hypothetical protein CME04_02865 [Gemmatimonadaceae bacterium]|jgi:hypothetical protein|nr:hypothetical protein [Gemmatimonadaceae bacterium]